MTRLYLAGPMSNLPDLNFPAFHAESARLRALGIDIVNPAEINCGTPPGPGATDDERHSWWQKCMKADIAQLVTCDGIAMLPGWDASRGAKIERYLAASLGMSVVMACDIVGQPGGAAECLAVADWAAA